MQICINIVSREMKFKYKSISFFFKYRKYFTFFFTLSINLRKPPQFTFTTADKDRSTNKSFREHQADKGVN